MIDAIIVSCFSHSFSYTRGSVMTVTSLCVASSSGPFLPGFHFSLFCNPLTVKNSCYFICFNFSWFGHSDFPCPCIMDILNLLPWCSSWLIPTSLEEALWLLTCSVHAKVGQGHGNVIINICCETLASERPAYFQSCLTKQNSFSLNLCIHNMCTM